MTMSSYFLVCTFHKNENFRKLQTITGPFPNLAFSRCSKNALLKEHRWSLEYTREIRTVINLRQRELYTSIFHQILLLKR